MNDSSNIQTKVYSTDIELSISKLKFPKGKINFENKIIIKAEKKKTKNLIEKIKFKQNSICKKFTRLKPINHSIGSFMFIL